MYSVKVSDFSKFPGPRYKKLGKNSGEEFRDKILLIAIKEHQEVQVNLDGVIGYGSSFLEEAFGGLIRAGVSEINIKNLVSNLKSKDNPELILEIESYINEQLEARSKEVK
jgi:hypothetical protein